MCSMCLCVSKKNHTLDEQRLSQIDHDFGRDFDGQFYQNHVKMMVIAARFGV